LVFVAVYVIFVRCGRTMLSTAVGRQREKIAERQPEKIAVRQLQLSLPTRRGWQQSVIINCSIYLFSFFLGIFSLYYIVDYITGNNQGAIGYLIGYLKPSISIGFSIKAPFLFAVGLIRSLFGVEILFRIPVVADFVTNAFSGKDFSDEIFMIRNMNLILVWTLTLLMIFVSGGLIAALIPVVKRIRLIGTDDKRTFWFIMIALASVCLPVVLLGPVLFGATANNEHLLPFWALFFLMMGFVYDRSDGLKRIGKRFALLMLAVLLVVNGIGSIYAMKNPQNDLVISSISPWVEVVKSDDLVVVRLTERDAAALSLMTGATTINTMHQDYPSNEFLIKWDKEHDGKVWIQMNMAEPDVKYPPVSGFKLEKWNNKLKFHIDDNNFP